MYLLLQKFLNLSRKCQGFLNNSGLPTATGKVTSLLKHWYRHWITGLSLDCHFLDLSPSLDKNGFK